MKVIQHLYFYQLFCLNSTNVIQIPAYANAETLTSNPKRPPVQK